MENELLPCPWCRSTNLHIEDCYIGCLSCGAIGPHGDTREKAIKAWNTRATPMPKIESSATKWDYGVDYQKI